MAIHVVNNFFVISPKQKQKEKERNPDHQICMCYPELSKS